MTLVRFLYISALIIILQLFFFDLNTINTFFFNLCS